MHALVTCTYKNEENPIKNEAARLTTAFLLLYPGFYACPRYLQGCRRYNQKMKPLDWPQHFCYYIRDFMLVLVTCKNEEDPIKNEDARVFTKVTQL